MDAKSSYKMQTVFAELLSSDFQSDERLGHFQDEKITSGRKVGSK